MRVVKNLFESDSMKYKPINCEASVKIYNKKDCAYHAVLGWSSTEWHKHKKGQLIYADHGIMRLYTKEKVWYIPSWHAAWIPTGIEHRVVTESVNLLFRTLYLDDSLLKDKFYKKLSVFYAPPLLREMILYTEKFNLSSPATAHEKTFLESLKLLLPEQARNPIQLHLPSSEHPRIQEITDYILSHLDETVSAPQLGLKFGISSRTILRLFQKEMGVSFAQYLKQARIARAVELLVKPGKNVSEVAWEVGYESLPTFSNNFKEVMGVRPNLFLQK